MKRSIHYFENVNHQFESVKHILKNPQEPLVAIQNLQEENANLKKQIEALLKEKAKDLKGTLKKDIREINGINFLAKKVDVEASAMKDLCFELGNDLDNLFILLGAENNGKAFLTCYISKELAASKDLNAGEVVRALGKHIQGGGGGQPFFATAGGKHPEGLEQAIKAAADFLI